MKRSQINILFSACFVFAQLAAPAQTAVNDSSLYATALKNTIGVYEQAMSPQAPVVNGRQYKPYLFTFIKEGHPFFETNQYADGTLHYEDKYYDSVRLLYDQHFDMVMLDAGVRLELISERLPEFSISGHRFVRLAEDTVHGVIAAGFYESLYEGGINLYKKEFKEFKEALSVTEGYQVEILDRLSFFIQKGGQFYRVKNKGALLEILKEKRGEVERYLKTKKLNFRRDKQNTITTAVIYFDQLTRSR